MYRPARMASAIVALTAFALAVVVGIAAGNPGDQVLFRAIVCMFVGQIVGWGAGTAAEIALREHIRTFRDARPVPEVPPVAGKPAQGSSRNESGSSSPRAEGPASAAS